MQGQLRGEKVEMVVETSCAHCSEPMTIHIDSDLRYRVDGEDCDPVIFVPDVNLHGLPDPSIIDSF